MTEPAGGGPVDDDAAARLAFHADRLERASTRIERSLYRGGDELWRDFAATAPGAGKDHRPSPVMVLALCFLIGYVVAGIMLEGKPKPSSRPPL